MIYGLLGKSLSHSISPRVHHLFGNAEYQLFETDDPFRWLKTHSFQGINITIPYKTTLLSVLDDVDSIVQKTGSLNCIVNRNGRLAGYNTDVDGFKQTLIHHQVAVQDKMVVLLGNGGAARSVRQSFLDLGAKKVVKLCRRILEKEEYLLSEAASFQAADILVNTTPIGMYPNNDTGPLLSLDNFPAAEVVIDLIYNPLKTSFLQRASELGKKTINGLYLLVAQAKKAHELFLNTALADDDVTRVYQQVNQELSNVIFVGLPLS
ncbi:MAG: shikimate dehydrogenase, partial [Candidatus Izemoplasmatales bacterium]|nr:shikimate dehydrogenase [Candidatus Izemoplasmatales bacterium]